MTHTTRNKILKIQSTKFKVKSRGYKGALLSFLKISSLPSSSLTNNTITTIHFIFHLTNITNIYSSIFVFIFVFCFVFGFIELEEAVRFVWLPGKLKKQSPPKSQVERVRKENFPPKIDGNTEVVKNSQLHFPFSLWDGIYWQYYQKHLDFLEKNLSLCLESSLCVYPSEAPWRFFFGFAADILPILGYLQFYIFIHKYLYNTYLHVCSYLCSWIEIELSVSFHLVHFTYCLMVLVFWVDGFFFMNHYTCKLCWQRNWVFQLTDLNDMYIGSIHAFDMELKFPFLERERQIPCLSLLLL